MYWYGQIDIDPTSQTNLQRKPTKGFRRFAEILTCGLLSEQEEVETFTAVSILQQINRVMRTIGVTDLVRMQKNETTFYEDEQGQHANDLDFFTEQIKSKPSTLGNEVFQTLSLLLEHHLPTLTLVIEIRVNRVHPPRAYPIRIVVNGLAAELQSSDHTELTETELAQRFDSQEQHDAFINDHRLEFEAFINRLELAIRQQLEVDDLIQFSESRMIRPSGAAFASRRRDGQYDASASGASDPVFNRYESSSDAFAYCWLWSQFAHNQGYHVSDTRVVNEDGSHLFLIGEEGIEAGATELLNPQIPLNEVDASALSGVVSDGSNDPLFRSWGSGDDSTSDSSWLSGFGIDSGGGDADSGSSCGSGCGGGCGGD